MRFHKHRLYEIIHTHVRSRKSLFATGKWWGDLFLLFILCSLFIGFIAYTSEFFGIYPDKVEIDLSLWHLPKYTFFSFSRGFFAYLFSFFFSLAWGFWAAKDKIAQKLLIPLLDILQSIPILGFMPGLLLLLVSLFTKRNCGLELAAIILMFTSQAWNMAFSVYQSIRTVPQEKQDAATVYRFTAWQRIRHVEIPFAIPSLIFNSIMSVAAGWFFLMVNEAFQLGDRDFRIPGLGSYMSVAAAKGDLVAMFWAILAMLLLIVTLDQLLWRPLVVWSQKFRMEETASAFTADSWFLNILNNSHLCRLFRKISLKLKVSRQNGVKNKPERRAFGMLVSRISLAIFCVFLVLALFSLAKLILQIEWQQWIHIGKMLLFTFSRVVICLAISTLVCLPLGLAIGLSEKYFAILQPIIQVMASFPASLLFPALIFVLSYFHITLGIGSVALMLLGTQWYILFNVIAGARAMPSDFKDVARSFHFARRQRFFWLNLPAIFPFLITGLVTAAGGAWNTSIVAEYVSFKGKVVTTPGLGSSISLAAQNGDIPLLAANIVVLAFVVGLLNYHGWLRLYNYSEKKYALNY